MVTTTRRRRKNPVWRKIVKGNIFLHRWVALPIGILLTLEVFTGVFLLYRPELYQLQNQELFTGTTTARPISQQEAVAVADRAVPSYDGANVTIVDNVYQIDNADYTTQYYVDSGSGKFLGVGHNYDGWLGWMLNAHDCMFSCEGTAGYLPFMATTPIPGVEISIGGFLIGIIGLAFVWLCISGIIAWWPGVKRFVKGFVIHRKRGQYRFNRDLHDVYGIIAIPFLLMWSITGAGYEFQWVGKIFYAATGTSTPEVKTFEPDTKPGPVITPDQAIAAADRVLPADSELVTASLPESDDPASYYSLFYHTGLPANANGGTRSFGDTTVGVDKHTGRAEVLSGAVNQTLGQQWWEKWNYGIHFGYAVPWGWRIIWLVFGIAPLVLAVTGFWTWYYRRRRIAKVRKQAALREKELATVGAPAAEPAAQPAVEPAVEPAASEQDSGTRATKDVPSKT